MTDRLLPAMTPQHRAPPLSSLEKDRLESAIVYSRTTNIAFRQRHDIQKIEQIRDRREFIGGETRKAGHAALENVIQEYEQSHPGRYRPVRGASLSDHRHEEGIAGQLPARSAYEAWPAPRQYSGRQPAGVPDRSKWRLTLRESPWHGRSSLARVPRKHRESR